MRLVRSLMNEQSRWFNQCFSFALRRHCAWEIPTLRMYFHELILCIWCNSPACKFHDYRSFRFSALALCVRCVCARVHTTNRECMRAWTQQRFLRMCLGICTTSDYQATISESKERSLRAPPFASLLLLLPLLLFLLLLREREWFPHRSKFLSANCHRVKLRLIISTIFPGGSSSFFSLSLFLNPFLTAIQVFRKTVTRAIKLRVLRRETMPRVLRLRRRRRGYVTIAGAINLSTHTQLRLSRVLRAPRCSVRNRTTYICVSRNRWWYMSANGASENFLEVAVWTVSSRKK